MTNRENSSRCEKATGKQLSHRNVNKITVSQVAVTLAAFSVCQYVQYMYRLYTLTYVEREKERERERNAQHRVHSSYSSMQMTEL